MRKLLAARRHLMSRLGLAADSLLTFAQDGAVTGHRAPVDARARNGRFALSYEAHIVVTDFTRPPANLLWAMLEWLHADNPGVAPDALKFHADILDRRRSDVHPRVTLTETIEAVPAAGGTALRPVADPDALAFGPDGFYRDIPDGAPDAETPGEEAPA